MYIKKVVKLHLFGWKVEWSRWGFDVAAISYMWPDLRKPSFHAQLQIFRDTDWIHFEVLAISWEGKQMLACNLPRFYSYS